MKALSLFSGIGGIDIAAQDAGVSISALCEIDPFPVSILKKRFPNIPVINDVRDIKGADYRGTVDFVYGGFPCQDLSFAGKRVGLEGERSKLWYEMLRVISECRPNWVLAENVRGAISKALDTVQAGLENEGYKIWTFVLPAAAFGAPHRRERMFVVAARQNIVNTLQEKIPAVQNDIVADPNISDGGLWPTITVCGNYNKRGLSKTSGDGLATTVKVSCGEEFMKGKTLNPDWCEQLMGFPEGWTNPDVENPEAWRGWPMVMKKRLWMTPKAGVCGMTARTKGRTLERSSHLSAQVYCAEVTSKLWTTLLQSDSIGASAGKNSLRTETHYDNITCPQYEYEHPRVIASGAKYRSERIKALGNAVVPAQVFPLIKAIVELNKIYIEEGGF